MRKFVIMIIALCSYTSIFAEEVVKIEIYALPFSLETFSPYDEKEFWDHIRGNERVFNVKDSLNYSTELFRQYKRTFSDSITINKIKNLINTMSNRRGEAKYIDCRLLLKLYLKDNSEEDILFSENSVYYRGCIYENDYVLLCYLSELINPDYSKKVLQRKKVIFNEYPFE